MFDSSQYELLGFGHGDKLERFANQVVCRETPSAFGSGQDLDGLPQPDLKFQRSGRRKHWIGQAPDDWHISFGDTGVTFELRQTPTGQVGVFPEQAVNWDFILKRVGDYTDTRAINLFGYTGGTTMALAATGAQVVHVDAAASVVKWARANAARSGLEQAPIRWIVEDANRFVHREIRRGNRYECVIADPPSFGRGPSGKVWKLERDIESLVEDLTQLLSNQAKLIMISCHTPGIDASSLRKICLPLLANQTTQGLVESFDLTIPVSTSSPVRKPRGAAELASGCCFRWSSR